MTMTESKSFQNKVILITGAARGIGLETAKYLATRGATLSLCDLSYSDLVKVEGELKEADAHVNILSQEVDVCDPESVKKWVTATKERFGRIDGCFNNAGG
jgi:NAD(P)-dependent dehydrogenase (short-subunit alcohol dehydrogenase family)